MKTEYFTATMQDAIDYPLHVRIAALWLASGKTEADFHAAYPMASIELTPTSARAYEWPAGYGEPDNEKLAQWVRRYTRSFQPGRPRYDAALTRLPLLIKAVVREGANILAVWDGVAKPTLCQR
jgi:hypothetical protein